MRQSRLLLGTLLLLGCTERLVTPGSCPTHCPGGFPEFRDTVLTAVPGADSSFTGYTSSAIGISLLLSNSDELGQSDALIRFMPRSDSVLAGDSLKPYTIDSISITLVLQQLDATVGSQVLDLYRLPVSFDTLSPFDAVRQQMTPENLLRSLSIPAAATAGPFEMMFTGEELDRFEFSAADSSRLVVAVRLRSESPTGLYIGALSSGTGAPQFRTYVRADIADTALQSQVLQRGGSQNKTVRQFPMTYDPDLLTVGGDQAARALLRFEFPEYLRDSTTIVRATLELATAAPLTGITGDSAQLDVRSVVADFGAKSAVNPNFLASGWIFPGDETAQFEVTGLVTLWQNSVLDRQALRLQSALEYSSFMTPVFQSTRQGSTPARIRITYRPRSGLGGF